MHKIGFVVNGKKGRKKRFLQETQKFREQVDKFIIDIQETSAIGHATSIALEMANSGFTHIISVGGDGTLNETINGIKKSANPNCSVGMLTYGTANDFARTINPPMSLGHLLYAIENNIAQKLDLGLIEQKIGSINYSRYFINIADLGIGAEVVNRVNNSSKPLGADLTFILSIIRTFFSYTNQPIECVSDQWQWSGKINSLIIANGKYFGSGMCLAPHANPNDGQFAITILGDISLWDYLKNLINIRKGKVIRHPQLEYKTAKTLKVTSPSLDCFIEADGEFLGGVPATITIKPKDIRFILV